MRSLLLVVLMLSSVMSFAGGIKYFDGGIVRYLNGSSVVFSDYDSDDKVLILYMPMGGTTALRDYEFKVNDSSAAEKIAAHLYDQTAKVFVELKLD